MKPSCISPDCMFYSRGLEECILSNDELTICCPCENGEFEAMYGENGELWDG